MAKLVRTYPTRHPTGPITSTHSDLTAEGGRGHARDAKSELFLLAVANLVGEDTFYEGATDRDRRFRDLIVKVTSEDPEWIRRFVPFLRSSMFMRSASIVAAAEYALAGGPMPRGVINAAIQRADEPAEFLAYWAHRTHKTTLPGGVQRGLQDAVRRLYTERNALKYDGAAQPWRFGDVIELSHTKPQNTDQSALFKYLIDSRHKREDAEPVGMIARQAEWRRNPVIEAGALKAAGVTWEVLSSFTKMDGKAWDAVISSMGVFALVRNLRNFDQADISGDMVSLVQSKLTSASDVKAARVLPIRAYQAWKAVASLRWGEALETMISLSLSNIPEIPGRTLILVDQSVSMDSRMSARSELTMAEIATVFGTALGMRCEDPEFIVYSDQGARINIPKAASVIRFAEAAQHAVPHGGTRTTEVLTAVYSDHDRVVLITDEQAFHSYQATDAIKAPIFTWNLQGYRVGHMPAGAENRYTFGGLSDAAFSMIPLIERGQSANWPF